MRGRAPFVVLVVLLALLAGCSGTEVNNNVNETQGRGPTNEETRFITQMVTVLEPTPPESTSQQSPLQEQSPKEVSPEEQAPEEVLALQYEYINSGDFEKAYALFAEQSRRLISLEQYRAFFEANAPYSVTDYSFPSVQVQGDSATVDAEFTVNSAGGVEQLERTQQLVRENGDWRVVMRPEQIVAFTAIDNANDEESTPEPEPETPSTPTATSGSVPPLPGGSCPSDAPIKGNLSSSGELIYHVRGGQFYNKTNAEQCFATESDAQDAGFRKSKR